MIVQAPTEVIPIWFIEKWRKEESKPGTPLSMFLIKMIDDWRLEEIRILKRSE